MFSRWYAGQLQRKLGRAFVHLVFGARQTGKSTLINSLLPDGAVRIDLSDPEERSRHLARPGEFAAICRAMPKGRPKDQPGQFVFVDEVQTVPSIIDAVQHLYAGVPSRWRSTNRLPRYPGSVSDHAISSIEASWLVLPWQNICGIVFLLSPDICPKTHFHRRSS